MSRKDQGGKPSVPNPSVRYYDFKGKSEAFKYYDAESKTEKSVFPLSFILLTVRNEVSGYHKKTKSGIWSNSIGEYDVAKSEFVVYSQKPDKSNNTLLAKGIWKEISEKAKGQGGKFTKVLYGYQEGVGIVKINLVGTAIEAFGNFQKENAKEVYTKLLEVKSVTKKDEDDDYGIPVFTLGKELTAKQDELAEKAFEELENYFKSKSSNNTAPQGESGEEVPEMEVVDDDLPF